MRAPTAAVCASFRVHGPGNDRELARIDGQGQLYSDGIVRTGVVHGRSTGYAMGSFAEACYLTTRRYKACVRTCMHVHMRARACACTGRAPARAGGRVGRGQAGGRAIATQAAATIQCRYALTAAGLRSRRSLCALPCVGVSVCRHECVDVCVDIRIDTCVEMCADMCADMCAYMCEDMCVEMCVYMCVVCVHCPAWL